MDEVPYNTGKVKIGSKYQRPVHPRTMSREELRIQSAYLNKPPTTSDKAALWITRAFWILAIGLILISD